MDTQHDLVQLSFGTKTLHVQKNAPLRVSHHESASPTPKEARKAGQEKLGTPGVTTGTHLASTSFGTGTQVTPYSKCAPN